MALAFLVACALTFAALESRAIDGFDFRAFYCAGAVAREHADPYKTQPLKSCEQLHTNAPAGQSSSFIVVPSPVPGYDIAIFAQLSRLPYPIAKALWNLILSLAAGFVMIALVRLSTLSPAAIFAALWLSLAFPSWQLGELIAIGIAAICLAALCSQRGQWRYAAIFATIALIEPHLGLPAWLALFIWRPQTRRTLLTGALLLGAVSLITLGPAQNLEYVRSVLPLQALSDLASDAQLSLSTPLHYAGISDAAALRLGTAAYGLMLVLAVYFSNGLSRKLHDDGLLVAMPAAFSLIGGSYVHVTYMAGALPLAMLLYSRTPQYKQLISAAIILLSIPWWFVGLMIDHRELAFIPMMGVVVLFLACELYERRTLAMCLAAIGLTAFLFVNGWYLSSANKYHAKPLALRTTIDERYPQASWQRANAMYLDTGLPASWLLRAPSWGGLLILACTSLLLVRPVAGRSRRLSLLQKQPSAGC
jgi:hypothetical protein